MTYRILVMVPDFAVLLTIVYLSEVWCLRESEIGILLGYRDNHGESNSWSIDRELRSSF